MTTKKFFIINGPNLNMLGTREPAIYGSDTLEDIKIFTENSLKDSNVEITWFQSNIEGEIVTKIQELQNGKYDALIINPAAYSHTSVAIYDAMLLLNVPIIEVHLTNTNARESFRQSKLTARAAKIIMEGLGKKAYLMAIKSQLI